MIWVHVTFWIYKQDNTLIEFMYMLKKLNGDSACKGGGESSSCGGLFRSSDGRWLKGYIRKVGVCDALHVELWGMYLGLEMT